MPVLAHAVGDPHHLVRQAAMSALRSLYPPGALAPLALAIAGAAHIGTAAIDELVELAQSGDDRASALVRGALDSDDKHVRAHAAHRLVKLYPAGSVEPQLLAARSRHGDVRLAAVETLASAAELTAEIRDAMIAALASEHDDLRLAAALALAKRGEPTGIEVLAGFLRNEDHADEALEALVSLGARRGGDGAAAAAEAIAARIEDDPDKTANRSELIEALGNLGHPAGAPVLVRMLVAVPPGQEDDVDPSPDTVLEALDKILAARRTSASGAVEKVPPQRLPDGHGRARYDEARALAHFAELAQSPIIAVRLAVAQKLGAIDDRGAEDVLARLLNDRDAGVRTAAAESLALRVEHVPSATLSALEAALRGGRRELVLAAAMGLAARKRPEAFQALMLVAKAGEPDERERAVVALGALGDARALPYLRELFEPGVDTTDADRALQPAAVEALARLLPALDVRAAGDSVAADEAADMRGRVERAALGGAMDVRLRALTGLRATGEARGLAIVEQVAADDEAGDDVRAHAVRQLGLAAPAARSPRSEAILADLLSSDDWQLRREAWASLATLLNDRTRLALHGLGSSQDDISERAARYLATAGDAAALVARLGGIRNAEVRKMLREGVIRRGELPVAALGAALAGDDVGPRIEAAWIAGAAGDRAMSLGEAVVAAAAAGSKRWEAARREADAETRAASEAEAWQAALWAARWIAGPGRVDAAATAALATAQAPEAVRRAGAHALAGNASALLGAVGDVDREVRAVASRTAAAAASASAASAAQAVRGLGTRADATTIAPLARLAWPVVGGELLTGDGTRGWAAAAGVIEHAAAGLAAVAADRKAAKAARIAALAALGRLGGDDVKRALGDIHGDDGEDDDVKLAAWKAIKRIARAEARAAKEAAWQGDKRQAGRGGGRDER